MKTRIKSGLVYVAILISFIAMKMFVPIYGDYLFDILILAFGVIGTYEMVHSFHDKISRAQKIVVYAFSGCFVPAFAAAQFAYDHLNMFSKSYAVHAMIIIMTFFASLLFLLLVFDYKNSTLEGLGASFISMVYPTCFLGGLLLANHLENNSLLAILFIITISPWTDSLALVVGMIIGGKKMAPEISPKKTISGGIGGLVGGVIGALVLYFIYPILPTVEFVYTINFPAWLIFAFVGLACAAATELGDLIESALKRKIGIKDMGNIMPGHGGILDRIDGMLLSAILVYALFFFFIR